MTSPIGIADSSPPIPTKGEAIPPKANEMTPRSAEALPVFSPCFCMARENPAVLQYRHWIRQKIMGLKSSINSLETAIELARQYKAQKGQNIPTPILNFRYDNIDRVFIIKLEYVFTSYFFHKITIII